MKILLLGKNGLLGTALFEMLSKVHEVVGTTRDECDVAIPKQIEKLLESTNPGIVINATGYTNVDFAESEPSLAREINGTAVGILAELTALRHIPLMHFSTDYVFDGSAKRSKAHLKEGYQENSGCHPINAYGESKLLGENLLQKYNPYFYLIRSQWLFGPHGKNFVDTILTLGEKNDVLRVVADQYGVPTYTLDLAAAVLSLLNGAPYGIYHIVNNGMCSWYEFATEIFHQLGIPKTIQPITSAELNRPAKRPQYSLLRSTKFPPLRPWKEALNNYLMHKTIIV